MVNHGQECGHCTKLCAVSDNAPLVLENPYALRPSFTLGILNHAMQNRQIKRRQIGRLEINYSLAREDYIVRERQTGVDTIGKTQEEELARNKEHGKFHKPRLRADH